MSEQEAGRSGLRWVDEEVETGGGTRVSRVAWLIYDAPDAPTRFLAYLGERPAVTPHLIEEVDSLYPEVAVDWAALRADLERDTGRTNVAALTDDEVALRLRDLAREHDLALTDLSLRLGYRQRYILGELLRFLDDPSAVARFERTSGSLFAYLEHYHPDYAFLLYKARLLFEGDAEGLRRAIREEPGGTSAGAWSERRAYWQATLRDYRERLRPPDGGDETGG